MDNRQDIELNSIDKSNKIEDQYAMCIASALFNNETQAVEMVKIAISNAKSDYISQDVFNVGIDNSPTDILKGVAKTLGTFGLLTLKKKITAEMRTPSNLTITNENYMDVLSQQLHASGDINRESQKGFLLRNLYLAIPGLKAEEASTFMTQYANNQIDLQQFWQSVTSNLKATDILDPTSFQYQKNSK